MKNSRLLCSLVAGFAVCSCAFVPMAQAQIDGAPQFGDAAAMQPVREKLELANSKIKACHVIWKRVLRIGAVAAANADPDEWAAHALKQARERGDTEAEAQEAADINRSEALRAQKTQEVPFIFDYTRDGSRVLCITEQFPSPTQQTKRLEYFDGINFLSADLEFDHKVESYKRGRVERHTNDMVSYSVGGEQIMRLLLGFPLDQEFGPRNPAINDKNSMLKDERPGLFSIVQESYLRKTGDKTMTWTNPKVFNYGKEHFALQSMEDYSLSIFMSADRKMSVKRGELSDLVTVSGYKEYEDGIWYPSKISVKSGRITQEYSLVEAQFNDEVKPSQTLLPADILITDGRFGFGKEAVEYYADDGFLLSDEQVKAQQKTG